MDWLPKKRNNVILQIISAILSIATLIDCSCQRNMLNARGLSSKDKQIILDYHNKVRQAVALGHVPGQPPAANMLEMKWDDQLERNAQLWALNCQSETHDGRRHIARFQVGQNIATMWKTAGPKSLFDMQPNFPEAMDEWFNEYRIYRFGPFSAYGSSTIGHYTQMAWAESNLVGCGFAYYQDVKGFNRNYICNYGPSGNVLTLDPYVKGQTTCSRFNYVPSNNYKGLCDKPKKYYEYDIHTNYIG